MKAILARGPWLLLTAGLGGPACRPPAGEGPCRATETGLAGSCDGWQEYVRAQRQRFEETQQCPDGPPELVSMLDGRLVELELVRLGEHGTRVVDGLVRNWPDQLYTSLVAVEGKETADCDSLDYTTYSGGSISQDAPEGVLAVGFRAFAKPDVESPVPFFQDTADTGVSIDDYGFDAYANLGSTQDGTSSSWISKAFPGDGAEAYAWLCVESALPDDPLSFKASPATWEGSLFVHAEAWTSDDSFATFPLDVYVDLEHIDCGHNEDALDYNNIADSFYKYDYWYWSVDCDGIDNDLDGLVDEYPTDGSVPILSADGNDIPDCLDDWDGDGIPNYAEESVGYW